MLSLIALGLGGGACGPQQKSAAFDPARVSNRWIGPATIAVAPALNFSGATDFDPAVAADWMASELASAEGINVIPVSRVLAVMARVGVSVIDSPEAADAVRRELGADLILVFAVTEYDPYEPPIVGLAAQLYGSPPGWSRQAHLDPMLVSRQARPFAVGQDSNPSLRPVAQVQRVFNASHDFIRDRVREYADARGDADSVFGWRLYLVSQEHYMRYCCYAAIEELIRPPHRRERAGVAEGKVEKL